MPQARNATVNQTALVQQLLALTVAQSDPDVTIVASGLPTPPEIQALLAAGSAVAAESRMVDDCKRLATPTLNGETGVAQAPGYLKLENWASGNAPPFYRYTSSTVTGWLSQLFAEVAVAAGHTLSRADLFHCHLVYDATGPDLLAIFHAKEYPDDIEPGKHAQAAGVDGGVVAFDTTSPAFASRNPIWSARTGRIYVPHFRDNTNPYRTLLLEPDLNVPGNPLFLDAVVLGDCIADINLFPRERVAPFQKIWSVKAVRPTCSLCNFRHTEGSSTALGRWHYCAACNAFYCNTCGKWKLSRKRWDLSRTRKCSACPAETVLVD
jgi:hypothetical protein